MDDRVLREMTDGLPTVWRTAVGLCGDEDRGRRVVREVMGQAQLAADSWDHEGAAERWFRHHTVLATRHEPETPPADDALVPADADPPYRAFVAALRKRPRQQREAWLLHHGERLDDRQVGVAMDCSVQAARVHLRGCGEALAPLAGNDFPAMTRRVAEAYRALDPPENVAVPRRRRSQLRRRLLAAGLFAGWALLLLFLAAAVVAAFVVGPRVEW